MIYSFLQVWLQDKFKAKNIAILNTQLDNFMLLSKLSFIKPATFL